MFKRILVLVDAQPASIQAVHQGVELARVNGGEVLFFHLLPEFDSMPFVMQEAFVPPIKQYEREIRNEASSRLHKASAIAETFGVQSSRSMGASDARSPAQCAADVAEKRHCELIVVGTGSRNALVRLMGGSIIPGLISCASVPVLVCQAKESRGKATRRGHHIRPSRGAIASSQVGEQNVQAASE